MSTVRKNATIWLKLSKAEIKHTVVCSVEFVREFCRKPLHSASETNVCRLRDPLDGVKLRVSDDVHRPALLVHHRLVSFSAGRLPRLMHGFFQFSEEDWPLGEGVVQVSVKFTIFKGCATASCHTVPRGRKGVTWHHITWPMRPKGCDTASWKTVPRSRKGVTQHRVTRFYAAQKGVTQHRVTRSHRAKWVWHDIVTHGSTRPKRCDTT